MSRAAGGKKFDKMNVARVYFGNWLRDYSQAIDVGTVKYVSAEAIRILLWVLGFMTFGYGTKEFEVTSERLGCYRPEDHIDNPKDYADNLDATQYDRRLRGPVDERVELAIDPNTGLKNYIANERAGIMTSALHVRKLFSKSIQLGRSYARSGNKDELYEALRLLGTGLHCLEDFSAHSNYTELALIEMGERDIFPHVGRQTQIRLQGAQGPVYPIITGTFGGVDFLHSVMGEFDDKATQSEISELEGSLQDNNRSDNSVLKDIFDKIPSGLFGGEDQASKADELQQNATAAQMSQMTVSPREPEEFTKQMLEIQKQIYPIIEWHDEIMKSITEAIEQIPVLPELIEQFEEQLNIFVFSLLAPFVVPIINQIKNELNTGSAEIIASSKDKQLIVFEDDHSSNPTHSMLSKDHFSNILNEPAGKIASQVLKWAVPQLIQCWDNENEDADRTINRIIHGVFHHPAQRNMGEDGASDGRRQMFSVVEQWWQSQGRSQNELRQKLSRQGVQNGDNHKEGVQDTGHGCCKPLKMATSGGGSSNTAAGALMGGLGAALGQVGGGGYGLESGGGQHGGQHNDQISSMASEAVGGGALGGLLGAVAGGLGGSLLSGLGGKQKTDEFESSGYTSSGGYQQSYSQASHTGDVYNQSQYSQTQEPGGGRRTEYQNYQQSGNQGYGYEASTEVQPTYGGGYEQTNQRRFERPGGDVETETWREGRTAEGQHYHESKPEVHRERRGSNDSNDGDHKKHDKHHKKHHDDSDEDRPQRYGGGYGEERRERFEEPPQERLGEGRFGGGAYGGGRENFEEPRRQEHGGSGYGGGRENFEEPRRQEYGGGGGFGGEGRGEYGGERFGGEGRGEYGGGPPGGFGGPGEPGEGRGEYGREGRFGGNDEEEYGEERRRDDRGGW
ncbi:hypothetical protein BP5796_03456 [Coleophoma crateriformis]|uniref:Het-C-domain-containing protein n=1 Tax=Coleophoma crateriformis TaxID=565419 RepID=A0A3D8SN95_9HELO|nr:hypothetical protein BP5796_03456 [Coleophoma crateriformis]